MRNSCSECQRVVEYQIPNALSNSHIEILTISKFFLFPASRVGRCCGTAPDIAWARCKHPFWVFCRCGSFLSDRTIINITFAVLYTVLTVLWSEKWWSFCTLCWKQYQQTRYSDRRWAWSWCHFVRDAPLRFRAAESPSYRTFAQWPDCS